jgi:asparagine synthase (glutamine-hydrolysing)
MGDASRQASARQALEEAIARALQKSPCVVSFSGGRDSSAMLALAAFVARRDGLPLPIPVTFRFPDVPSTHESEWQELVVRHLGLVEWERMDLTTELDLLGEIACDCLNAHGLLWPPNAYLHVPIFRSARHGTVVTGVDGDGLFGTWRWCHAQSVLHGRTPFELRDVVRIGFALAPPSIRRQAIKRRHFFVPDWLRPHVQHEFSAAVIDRAASEPRRWDRRLEWHASARALHLAITNLALIASTHGVEVVHPLLDPNFLSAMAVEGGAVGYGDRTAAMAHLFSDLLPKKTIERPSKAEFGRAAWRENAREFAKTWDGSGVDPSMVDPELLRLAWSAENPVLHSWTLLHSVWLAAQEKTQAAASQLK